MAGYGQANSVMGDINRMNNYNQQFGGRSVVGSGQKPAQPRGQTGQSKPWYSNMMGSAQRFLQRI